MKIDFEQALKTLQYVVDILRNWRDRLKLKLILIPHDYTSILKIWISYEASMDEEASVNEGS